MNYHELSRIIKNEIRWRMKVHNTAYGIERDKGEKKAFQLHPGSGKGKSSYIRGRRGEKGSRFLHNS